MTNKEIINKTHEGLVTNWGESAQLLSFNQVMELMELAREDERRKAEKARSDEAFRRDFEQSDDWRNITEMGTL